LISPQGWVGQPTLKTRYMSEIWSSTNLTSDRKRLHPYWEFITKQSNEFWNTSLALLKAPLNWPHTCW
jgi:hypothetical protein